MTISIRQLQPSDQDAFLTATNDSVTLHQPWLTAPLTALEFKQYLTKYNDERNACFVIMHDEGLAGVVNLNEIVRGVFQSAYGAFFVFDGYQARGVMTQGLQQVIQYAFNEMALHRIEANIQPKNHASLALVKRCGFKQEGYSPKYLFLDNQWRDHERWAILAGE